MPNQFHQDLTLSDVHALNAQQYADVAARDADTDFHVAVNLNKVVRVESPVPTYYVMTTTTPAWAAITNGAGGGIVAMFFAEESTGGTADTILSVVDTYQALNFTTLSTSVSVNFTLSTPSIGEITFNGTGVFTGLIQINMVLSKSGGAQDYRFSISINGAIPVFVSAPNVELGFSTTPRQVIFMCRLTSIQPGDTIQLMVAGDGHTNTITMENVQFDIFGSF